MGNEQTKTLTPIMGVHSNRLIPYHRQSNVHRNLRFAGTESHC